MELDGEPFQVAGVVDGTTAYSPRANWVLMDRANARPFTDTLVPRAVLVRFAPGADAAAVTAGLATISGEGTTVVTPGELAAELGGRPTAQGLVTALVAAIVLASLLTALAIVLTLVVGRPARIACCRCSPRWASVAAASRRSWPGRSARSPSSRWSSGALLGALLPFVVLQGIDLRAFTAGDAQPAVAYDPWLITAVLAGSVLVTAAAAAANIRIGNRASAACAMRKEEEG